MRPKIVGSSAELATSLEVEIATTRELAYRGLLEMRQLGDFEDAIEGQFSLMSFDEQNR